MSFPRRLLQKKIKTRCFYVETTLVSEPDKSPAVGYLWDSTVTSYAVEGQQSAEHSVPEQLSEGWDSRDSRGILEISSLQIILKSN